MGCELSTLDTDLLEDLSQENEGNGWKMCKRRGQKTPNTSIEASKEVPKTKEEKVKSTLSTMKVPENVLHSHIAMSPDSQNAKDQKRVTINEPEVMQPEIQEGGLDASPT